MTDTQRKLIAIIDNKPELILTNEHLMYAACEHLLRIISRAKIVPLVPNNTQKMIFMAYLKQKIARQPVRQIILKGRQQGSSTGVAAIMQLEMFCRGNLTALVASEKKSESAINIFNKYTTFIQHYPIFPAETPRNDRYERFNDSDKFLMFNGSNLRIEGQGDVISYTNEIVHISEASRFTNFQDFLGSCLQGTEELEGTCIFIESTAKDYGDGFHNEWNRAKRGESSFIPIFAPWHIHERNVLALPADAKECEDFIKSIGEMKGRYGDELALQTQYGLTYEQLYWRRERIDNSCQGSLAMFAREYPSNDTEAFLASDSPVLDVRSLEWYHERTHSSMWTGMMLPNVSGKREDGSQRAQFTETPHGAIEIWKTPEIYKEYIAASDHSEGLPTGDYNAALIASRLPFEIVAKIHGNDATKLDEVAFSKQLYYLLRWYGWASVLPEANAQGGTVISMLNEWGYPNVLWENEVFPDLRSKRQGWYNTTSTRKRGFDMLYDALRIDFGTDDSHGRMRSEFAPIIPDRQTIEECQHIVWKSRGRAEAKRKGEYRAPGSSDVGCHDDLTISLIGLIFAQKALGPCKTEDEMKMVIHGPDHPLTDHMPREMKIEYERDFTPLLTDESGMNDWLEEL